MSRKQTDRSAGAGRRRAPEDARREILEGAAAFLRTHEWRELTVARVMAGTTLSRPSFYLHFEGRVPLLLELGAEVGGTLLDRGDRERWLRGSADVYTSARDALEGLVLLHRAHGPVIRALIAASYHEPELARARREIEGRFTDSTAVWLRHEMEIGRAPAGDAGRLAEALTTMTEEALVRWNAEPSAPDPAELTDVLLRIWIGSTYGITPAEARERWVAVPDPAS